MKEFVIPTALSGATNMNLATVYLFTHIGPYQNFIIAGNVVFWVVLAAFLYFKLLQALYREPNLFKTYVFSSIPGVTYVVSSIAFLMWYAVFVPLFIPGTLYYLQHREEYANLEAEYYSGQSGVVEGVVHVIHAQDPRGHDQGDIIEVGGITLEINYFSSGFGYHTTISHHGVLTEGTYARIYYSQERLSPDPLNQILRIDVQQQ